MSNSLVVQGKSVEVATLVSPRAFIAAKFGIELPKVAKGEKGISMKELKAQIILESETDEATTVVAIKAANKEYDAVRNTHYRNSALITGQLAADPTVRKSLRVSVNKKGECVGAVTTFRKEKSASLTQAARIQQLEAMLATYTAAAALPASV